MQNSVVHKLKMENAQFLNLSHTKCIQTLSDLLERKVTILFPKASI